MSVSLFSENSSAYKLYLGGIEATQNHSRVSGGMVYRRVSSGMVYSFGKTTNSSLLFAKKKTQPALKIAALGVLVAISETKGAEIIDEAPNGVAALAGLRRGDVINSVNGSPVATPAELEDALSFVTPGTKTRLGYAISGLWQAETTVLLKAANE